MARSQDHEGTPKEYTTMRSLILGVAFLSLCVCDRGGASLAGVCELVVGELCTWAGAGVETERFTTTTLRERQIDNCLGNPLTCTLGALSYRTGSSGKGNS